MKAENGFLEELRKSCELQKVNFEEVKKGIDEIIGEDQILKFYITSGPSPKFKKTILDTFILTESYLCDYEILTEGHNYYLFPLKSLLIIKEATEGDYVYAYFSYASGSSLVMPERKEKRKELRGFVAEIKKIAWK